VLRREPRAASPFDFNAIVYIFREESLLEAPEIDISAFKDYQMTVPPTQLQAKTPVQLAEEVVPASVTGYFQRMAETDHIAGSVRLGKCHWRGVGVRRPKGTPLGSIIGLFRADPPLRPRRQERPREGPQLFNKGADAEHVQTICDHGGLLDEGRGVPQAIRHIGPAADYLVRG
jgi:hypothetical protein